MKVRLIGLAAALAASAAAAAALAAPADPIKLGAIFDRSGPTSDVGVPYSDGVQAYVAFLNSRGGLGGRKLELVAQDTSYNVARSEQWYNQMRSSGVVAIQGWATADTEAFKGKVAADRLPYMSASYAESVADPSEAPYNFFVAPTYSDQMRIALKFIAKKSGNRRASVAVFYNDSPFGRSPLEDGKEYIDEKRLRIDYETYAMPRTTDFTPLLTQAKGKGANWIIIQNVSTPAAALVRDIQRSGAGFEVICLNWCADELLVGLTGRSGNGVYGIQPFGTTALDVPGLKQPEAWYARSGGGSIHKKGIHYVQGWYTMATMAEAIRRLVQSGRKVDGPSIKSSLETMPAFSTGGVTEPIKFSTKWHAGNTGSRVFQVARGRFRQVEKFTKP
jgi:branched-chain amino acid transport system substrate-binding protein